jgi:peptidoglycan/xylan/chitin deacetylase (PgdA/CDA1 family)
MYHRIADVATDPQLLCVSAAKFGEHLELIRNSYVPARLVDLVGGGADGTVPARAAAVTFDDGYADNLDVAKPLLERNDVPATVFVTSGYVGGRRAFWWDELERLLLRPGRLPVQFVLDVAGERLPFDLGGDAVYSPARASASAGWTVLDAEDPGPRQQAYRVLSVRLRMLEEADRERVLDSLRSLAAPDGSDAVAPRTLTLAEVALLDGGPVEVGAHTVTHPVLSQLSPQRQEDEIVRSKQELESAVDRPISSFAYPYGASGDFDRRTVALVRANGFDHACTSVPGRLSPRADRFRLPRLAVRNWDAEELARRLAELRP